MAQSGTPQVHHPYRRIVWPLALGETLVWAAFFYSFPALLPQWETELGWSKTELSGAFTLALVTSAILAPTAGRLIDRNWGSQVLAGGAVFGAVCLALLSQATTLWQFYLLWFGLGIAMAACLYEPCFAVLTHTLGSQAKRAITLVTLVAGFAGTLSFPSAAALSEGLTWRGALLIFAAVVILVALPLLWIGSRRATAHPAEAAPTPSRHAGQAFRVTGKLAFWLLALSYALIALDHGMIITHLLPILADRAIQGDAAILAAAMIGPMQVAGRLAMMAAERHISVLAIATGCYLALCFAALALLGAAAVPSLLVGFVILQGAGNGVTSIIRPVITALLLGRRNFGLISGLLAIPFVGGIALAPTVAALGWDIGGYNLVLWLAVAFSLLGLLALLAAWNVGGSAEADEA